MKYPNSVKVHIKCKPVAIFNVVDLSATAFKIKITRKEVFGLHIIPENHKVNAVLSQDSQLRWKNHRQKSLFNVKFKFKCTTRTRSEQ